MSHRLPQIESTLRRAIGTVLQQGLGDPRVTGMITVTRVSVSPDLHEARVFVSVMPESQQELVVHGLRHAAGRIRRTVGEEVSLRTMPRLDFRLDGSLKKQAAVMQAIARGMERETPPTPPEAPLP